MIKSETGRVSYLRQGVEFLLQVQLDQIPEIGKGGGEHIARLVDHRCGLIVAMDFDVLR